jgi:hypothetical protein
MGIAFLYMGIVYLYHKMDSKQKLCASHNDSIIHITRQYPHISMAK